MSPPELKEIYEPVLIHTPFYTGGCVEWTSYEDMLLCQCSKNIKIIHVGTGNVIGYLGDKDTKPGEDDSVDDFILTFALSRDDLWVATAHKSGLLKLWHLETRRMERVWKSVHKGQVAVLQFGIFSDVLASGGSDSILKIWNVKGGINCTHHLKGVQGVFNLVKFFNTKDETRYVFGTGDDTSVKGWTIQTGEVVKTLTGHFSKVTGLEITPCSTYIVTTSRDKVMILWDFSTCEKLKIIPLYESIEGLVLLPNKITIPGADVKFENGVFVAVAGEKGSIQIWDAKEARKLYTQTNSVIKPSKETGGLAVTQLLYNRVSFQFALVSVDHNIIFHSYDDFKCEQQLVGFSDEILDMVLLGEKETHLAVATNSDTVKLYDMELMKCQILVGHTDLVVALASTPAEPNLFASASKDNSVRLWMIMDDKKAICVASGMLHSSCVGAVAFSQMKTDFFVSGSQDTTLKLWNLPKDLKQNKTFTLSTKIAKIAHEKEINGISVSPNDKIIASASMDKTAKLWSVDDLTLLGTLRGHRRGVWSIHFSPVDQVVVTTSADSTIKLWSIQDLTCLKSLEGHDASVMNGVFVTRGLQVLSTGGDGLMKLWNLKTSECVNSFDSHNGKIWALTMSANEDKVITGGADSQIVIWKDVTVERKLEEARRLKEKALKEQQLTNLMKNEDFANALRIALDLNRPATVLKIIQSIIDKPEINLHDTIMDLTEDEQQILLDCIAHWNTNNKTCYPAQMILKILGDDIALGYLKIDKALLASLVPYTQRHFVRLKNILKCLHVLEFSQKQMKPSS